jgi:hypothetical protein
VGHQIDAERRVVIVVEGVPIHRDHHLRKTTHQVPLPGVRHSIDIEPVVAQQALNRFDAAHVGNCSTHDANGQLGRVRNPQHAADKGLDTFDVEVLTDDVVDKSLGIGGSPQASAAANTHALLLAEGNLTTSLA